MKEASKLLVKAFKVHIGDAETLLLAKKMGIPILFRPGACQRSH